MPSTNEHMTVSEVGHPLSPTAVALSLTIKGSSTTLNVSDFLFNLFSCLHVWVSFVSLSLPLVGPSQLTISVLDRLSLSYGYSTSSPSLACRSA